MRNIWSPAKRWIVRNRSVLPWAAALVLGGAAILIARHWNYLDTKERRSSNRGPRDRHPARLKEALRRPAELGRVCGPLPAPPGCHGGDPAYVAFGIHGALTVALPPE